MKRILILTVILVFACSSDSEGNPCIYEPTLETNAVTDITETSATLNGVISIVSENCDVPNNTEQGFVYSTEIQPTLEDTQVNVNGTNISTTIEGLTPNTTYYVRAFLTNNLGDFYGDEVSFSTTDIPCDVVYLDDNGITIKACPDANVGDVGTVNGVEYTIVDRAMLDQMIENEEDVTKVCTTLISDMANLFLQTNFNQDISSWDVSSVNLMNRMFSNTPFNQAIGSWDVSSVTDMSGMFFWTLSFNQPLNNWDTSSVTSMSSMFWYSEFNQPIGNWDVSNVINMGNMFINSPFNQDISSWDVSNVTEMNSMFSLNENFNQDLSNWNVENVTNCGSFSGGASSWTLPQPNFTNCNPN